MRRFFYISVLFFISFGISNAQDKLVSLRTNKKIIPTEQAVAPYYAIQILALKEAPSNPDFFGKVDLAKEWSCKDGFVRYTVGEYSSSKEANLDLDRVKSLGYGEAFVVNTKRFNGGHSSRNNEKIYPNEHYTIQLSAFRFPVYLSFFKEFESVQEYYLKDKIYRYCVGDYLGSESTPELEKVRSAGYPGAFLVPIKKYQPYKIE